jgi:integrase
MRDYTAVIEKTPAELINEAKDEIRNGTIKSNLKLKGYLIRFRKFLQDKNSAETTIRTRIAGVKSFYGLHDIDVPKLPRRGRKARVQPKKENKVIPTKEDIQDVLKLCDPLEKAILLVGVASGLSSNEILNLKPRFPLPRNELGNTGLYIF